MGFGRKRDDESPSTSIRWHRLPSSSNASPLKRIRHIIPVPIIPHTAMETTPGASPLSFKGLTLDPPNDTELTDLSHVV